MNNQEILDFIVKKENLQIAMEISTHIEDLKRQTHNDFWLGMNQELVRLFEEQRLDKWTFGKFNMKRL